MNEKQQTAIHWLWNLSLIKELMITDFEKALAMEQKQIETAYDQGYNDSYYKPDNDGKQYFIDTYQTEDENAH